jgi:hypothetical protein
MKKLSFIFLILFSSFSCKKDKTEYLTHDSEIFLNGDTLLIGKWDYLYTWSGGGVMGVSSKSFENLPTLKIKPKGNYEILKNGDILLTGVIDTIGSMNRSVLVIFYPNGIRSGNINPQSLRTHNTDTLIMSPGIFGDMYRDSYYVRAKD